MHWPEHLTKYAQGWNEMDRCIQRVCYLKLSGHLASGRRWCSQATYPNGQADGHLNSCCPQSIAFGALGEFQQGQAKKSYVFYQTE